MLLPALLSCLVLLSMDTATAADTLKGLVECLSHSECLGANRICSHADGTVTGRCACKEGYVPSMQGFACLRKAQSTHVTCETDEDCDRNEVCMSWQYDPALPNARKLRSRLSPGGDHPETHQFCIDAWIIYNNHLEDLDEPRTGGGLRSNRRNFENEEYFFSGRRPPRQYNAFGEDMMLILFLVCILATLVTVHRAACYRQIQDARRNTPLRHILPIPEDSPPPYTHRSEDTEGITSIVYSSSGPKPLTEAPPPSYEEALNRQTVRLSNTEEQVVSAVQDEVTEAQLAREDQGNISENIDGVNNDPTEVIVVQSRQEILEPPSSENIGIENTELERLNPTSDVLISLAAIADGGEEEAGNEEAIETDEINISNEDYNNIETAKSKNLEDIGNVKINKDENDGSVSVSKIACEEGEKLINNTDDGVTNASDQSSNVVHV